MNLPQTQTPFDPRLVSLIAAEVADPFDLAAEFGLAASEFRELRETPAFRAALEHARRELEETGFSAEYAEMLILQEAFPVMLREVISRFHRTDVTVEQKLKIVDQVEKSLLARRGRLSPRKAHDLGATLPMIQIILPGSGQTLSVSASDRQTIDVTPTATSDE